MRQVEPWERSLLLQFLQKGHVCRMHGAGGGASKGNKNALKHGRYTAEAIAERRVIRELLRDNRELLDLI